MTPEEQRIAIAEACGWSRFTPDTIQYTAQRSDGKWGVIPDFLNDLNACAEMEKSLTDDEYDRFYNFLRESIIHTKIFVNEERRAITSSSALQRSEAFLRAKGLWKESK